MPSPKKATDEVPFLESFSAFTGVVGSMGAELPLKTLARCRYWYGRSIGAAVAEHPGIWKGQARTYALGQVQRVAGHAATDALLGNGTVSTAILDQAVLRVVREQAAVCKRAGRRGVLKVLGVFCATIP